MRSPGSDFEAPQSLRRRFELAQSEVTIAGRVYRLLRPRNVDDLISEEDFAIDERIPYWADVWPSARILAERLAPMPGAGQSLLELGCGVGLPSLVAAAAGFKVLATDYYAEALEFTEANAERNGLAGVDTRLVDWRRLPDDLGRFDVILAADVLYEKPQAALVAGVLDRCLAPGGWALVSDPGRRTADAFAAACDELRLKASCVDRVPTVDAGASLTVSIFEVRRAALTDRD
jgi:predicted nicotinamide N-methyase